MKKYMYIFSKYQNFMFFLLLFAVLLISITLFETSQKIEDKLNKEIIAQKRERAQLDKLRTYITNLNSVITKYQIQKLPKEQAYRELLKAADFLIKNFNAVILGEIQEEGNFLKVKLSIKQDSVSTELLEFLEKSIYNASPIYVFEEFEYLNEGGIKLVLSLVQPFSEV